MHGSRDEAFVVCATVFTVPRKGEERAKEEIAERKWQRAEFDCARCAKEALEVRDRRLARDKGARWAHSAVE